MFYYNENALSDMLSSINKNISQMCDMENGYLNKMDSISKSGMYGNGIEMIDSQIVSIKDGLTDFRNITNINRIAVEETENKLMQDVYKIELPNNFDADDIGLSISTNSISLYKNNGNAIKSNNISKENSLDDYHDINVSQIKTFVKDAVDNIDFKDFEESEKINITNINNGSVNTSEMDDIKEAQKMILNNINKNIEINSSKLDDYTETDSNLNLENINNNYNGQYIDESIIRGDDNDYKSKL